MKTKRKCIFLFGYGRFDQRFESVSFILAKEFAKNGNKVYYIDYPFTTKDAFRSRNSESYQIRKSAFKTKTYGILDTDVPNLKIIVIPPLWSIHFLPEGKLYRKLLSINEKVISRAINEILKANGITEFIFFNSWVFHYPNVSKYIQPTKTVYHCIDPIVMDYDIKHGKVSEQQLINQSDIIICTSKQLYEERKSLHPNTHFVSNAADIKHSILATDENLQIYDQLLEFRKPIIGYFGNIEKRIDYELMRAVAKENEDKTFVFAGPIEKHWVPDFFFSIPNVHFLGRIPYDKMPNVVKGFDIAIIPFRKYEHSATVFPMKLFEYLGAGKPVIATDFNPDLKKFTDDLVAYCSNVNEFSAAINKALSNDNDFLRKERIKLASQHTWESKAAAIEELMANT
jgi:teichuronic acid biosynthesis glycosyltransferase TuaH